MNYLHNGEKLDQHNLTDFLIERVNQRNIPHFDSEGKDIIYYCSHKETNDKLQFYGSEYDKTIYKLEKIKWKFCYSGGWGLGYSSSLTYFVKDESWRARFVPDSLEIETFLNKPNTQIVDEYTATIYSNDINDVIDYPFYYGLYYDYYYDYYHGENKTDNICLITGEKMF
jgi:hypothetical protein